MQLEIINKFHHWGTVNNLTLQLDEKKKYNMRLLQSNIVYCSPNVFTDNNNKLIYKYICNA